ncbi:YicC/YloC family endoribonuclease [Idiomarina sp. UBA4206]|uniref:YicC/YloC family endoribonuclease n=1 Tax=Idiomarina sp. UBA4206 TaxID=1946644 RepID=UPI00257AFF22|nr:YicC/YloC family endoribonuclease [Idiomarina sp. UBA4206]
MSALQSMTGFGRGEVANDDFHLVVEIKSVNHRFKDIRIRMPSAFNALETNLRQQIGERFKRGSFDISIHLKKAEGKTKFDDIDEAKIQDFVSKIAGSLSKSSVVLNIDPTAFLRNEFQKDQDLEKDPVLPSLLDKAFSLAMDALEKSRLQEGEKLSLIMENHRKEYIANFSKIESKAESFKQVVEERLKKKLQDLSKEIAIDEPRYLQEVIYYLEKMDVHEEINRINAHLQKFSKLMSDGGEAGRQIDFMVQELGRETNTIGSKSSIEEVSEAVVQMKLQLEKIREQGLNLE